MKVCFFFKISLFGCQRVDFERFLSQAGKSKFATVGKGDFGRFIPYPPVNPPLVKRKIIDSKGYVIVPCIGKCFFLVFSFQFEVKVPHLQHL